MYDVYGKVTEVRERSSGILKVKFVYNAAGMRVEKAAYTNAINYTTTYYAYAGGGLSAVYSAVTTGGATGLTTHDELLIHGGGGRLGTAYLTNACVAKYVFEVKDHLGNVRTAFRRLCLTCSTVYIESYADYYPYGWALPGRNGSNGAAYRYGFQGEFAEKDPETGWTAFDLRMLDTRLARWMAPDPYGQFWSPYLSMGNDPINFFDRDGGFTKFGAKWYAFWNGGTARPNGEGNFWVVSTSSGIVAGGKGSFWNNATDFTFGFANAWASNNFIGPREYNPRSHAFYYGQVSGDVASVIQGGIEIGLGLTAAFGGTVGGVVTTPTGVGALAGAGVATAGIAGATHGSLVGMRGIHSILYSKKINLDDYDDFGGASNPKNPMKGGKQSSRDRDFGINDDDFWHWWHRDPAGKKAWRRDLGDDIADDVYEEWINLGSPRGPK